jgi:hypothetical protein
MKLRVFLSSPGDVADERGIARQVLARLQQEAQFGARLLVEDVPRRPRSRLPQLRPRLSGGACLPHLLNTDFSEHWFSDRRAVLHSAPERATTPRPTFPEGTEIELTLVDAGGDLDEEQREAFTRRSIARGPACGRGNSGLPATWSRSSAPVNDDGRPRHAGGGAEQAAGWRCESRSGRAAQRARGAPASVAVAASGSPVTHA